jgi:DNA-binding CsgD family transcriptional regulator
MKGFIYLEDLAHGMLIKQVAEKHAVSVSAVDKAIHAVRVKLDAKTTCEAVYKASKRGLIVWLIIAMSSVELQALIVGQDDLSRTRHSQRVRLKGRTSLERL